MGKVDDWLAWLIPRRCVLCHAPSGPVTVCAGCREDLPWLPGTAQGPVLAAFSYEYPVDRLVTGAKFHRQLHYTRALGEMLVLPVLDRNAPPPDLLVPVPLHPRRLAERGYNQALEITRPVAEALGMRPSPALCVRVRHTPEQTGLTATDRRRNLRGAFAVRGDCSGARVAVVDDVITTGSTVAALALALRRAGAARVEAWAVARTP